MDITSELRRMQREIEDYARAYGLDFFPVIFEVVDYAQLNSIASYEGFPVRYPHWRFGMHYERIQKSSSYGLHRIYEMVINNDPCYAYLFEGNSVTDHKIVMAHVMAHSDFFKNNMWFSKTNRKMIDQIANHSARIRRHIDAAGIEAVEGFIDTALSVEDLIDFHGQFIAREEKAKEKQPAKIEVKRLQSKDYMEHYINPPEYLEARKKALEEEAKKKKKFPPSPARDILKFLLEYAPIEDWQVDILSIIREEASYFIPQKQTKIMNEGWAAFWHSKIMTTRALKPSEFIDYADHHAGTLAVPHPGALNPYRLGMRLFEDIQERWDKGKFGKEYGECSDYVTKKNWNKKLKLGTKKIFEVRKLYNDITFIDEFLTPEFCEAQKFYTYEFNPSSGAYEIASRDFSKVKAKLLFMLTNGGNPIIELTDANFGNKGELYLTHKYEGVELHIEKAEKTLKNLHKIWTRPVQIETVIDGSPVLLRYDGNEHSTREVE